LIRRSRHGLEHEKVTGYSATIFQCARRRRGYVIVDANFCHTDAFRFRFFNRNTEIQDIAGIVSIDQYDTVGSPCLFDYRQDRVWVGRRKHQSVDRPICHSRSGDTEKQWFMTASATDYQFDPALHVTPIDDAEMVADSIQRDFGQR
jgi:hypothetical protein